MQSNVIQIIYTYIIMKLIDKENIVAEINRKISLFKKEKKTEKWSAGASQINVVNLCARITMLEEILSFLDTLEVKEVDLEKEIQQHLNDCLDIKFPTIDIKLIAKDVEYTARKFFELGFKTSKSI